ncbi:hypothetical protein JTB14_027836 [Gonioctena quinquepunctata]|nr:hypothetical protein JTB14_027836 [Gonioctena quinquepunctata]
MMREEWQRTQNPVKRQDILRLSREVTFFIQDHKKQKWERILVWLNLHDRIDNEEVMLDQHKVEVIPEYYSDVHRTADDITE